MPYRASHREHRAGDGGFIRDAGDPENILEQIKNYFDDHPDKACYKNGVLAAIFQNAGPKMKKSMLEQADFAYASV